MPELMSGLDPGYVLSGGFGSLLTLWFAGLSHAWQQRVHLGSTARSRGIGVSG